MSRVSLLRRVPPAVKAVRVPPGERRTAWATTADGGAVVATDEAVLLPDGTRLAWAEVEHVTWGLPQLVLTEVAEVQGQGREHVLVLDDADGLPAEVRTRVMGSVAWSSHERLSPSGGVRIVGRRVPGLEVLSWQLVYDAGTDTADPLVRHQAEALLEGARRSIG